MMQWWSIHTGAWMMHLHQKDVQKCAHYSANVASRWSRPEPIKSTKTARQKQLTSTINSTGKAFCYLNTGKPHTIAMKHRVPKSRAGFTANDALKPKETPMPNNTKPIYIHALHEHSIIECNSHHKRAQSFRTAHVVFVQNGHNA